MSCETSVSKQEVAILWPQGVKAVETCVPYEPGFVEPTLQEPSGDVRIAFSAALEPTGTPVLVEVNVMIPGTETVDQSAQGTMVFTLGTFGEVTQQTAIEDGRATAWIRFSQPGQHVIFATAQLNDEVRIGQAEVVAFTTQLPIWQITLDEDAFAEMKAEPFEKIYSDVALTIEGDAYEGRIRLHGGSSRELKKKSFRIDLENGSTKNGQENLILRAEYGDKSLLRNWLGYELFSNTTWLPTPESELVHVRINGEYYGVMNHVERIDEDFMDKRGLSRSASMYEADPPLAYSVPGGNLTPLSSLDEYRVVYQWHQGTVIYDDLIEFVSGVLQSSNSTFRDTIASHVIVEDVLVYAAQMAMIQNHDHIRKNFYIVSDTHGDDPRWRFIPWDLDLAFGHLWTEQHDVLDETVFVDADPFVGVQAPQRFGYYNQLFDRLLTTIEHRDTFLGMMAHMLDTTFTEEFVSERLDSALCRATPDILADHRKRASNAEYLARVDEIREFVVARRQVIEEYVAGAPALVPTLEPFTSTSE